MIKKQHHYKYKHKKKQYHDIFNVLLVLFHDDVYRYFRLFERILCIMVLVCFILFVVFILIVSVLFNYSVNGDFVLFNFQF